MSAERIKDLNYYRSNAEEDYLKTPISVLRYISELESQQSEKEKELYEALDSADKIISKEVDNENWILSRAVIKQTLEKHKPNK